MASVIPIDENGQRIPKGSRARAHRYVAKWRTPDGKSREQWFERKIDAERHLTSVENSKLVGAYVDPMAGRVTFKTFAEGWLTRKRTTARSTTTSTFESYLRTHLYPAFGTRELRAITREQVVTFAAQLGQDETNDANEVTRSAVAASTGEAILRLLRAVLDDAVDLGKIARNPATKVKVGTSTDHRVSPLDVARLASKVPSIADGMPARYRAGVYLMASTGLRLGECLGLTVDRVDFLRRTIVVDRQLSTATRTNLFVVPKTKSGSRSIPVPARVTDMLAAHLAEFPANEAGLILSTEIGGPVVRPTWQLEFRKAWLAAGLTGRARTHDLRHVAASALIASGLSVAAVQAVLGHATPSETLDVYTHFWSTDEDRTREAIERAAASWASA